MALQGCSGYSNPNPVNRLWKGIHVTDGAMTHGHTSASKELQARVASLKLACAFGQTTVPTATLGVMTSRTSCLPVVLNYYLISGFKKSGFKKDTGHIVLTL